MTAQRKQPARAAANAASLWIGHDAAWRDPHQVVSQWQQASDVDPALLAARSRGRFWEAAPAAERRTPYPAPAPVVHAARVRRARLPGDAPASGQPATPVILSAAKNPARCYRDAWLHFG